VRIALLKPDFRVRGGFEAVADRIAAILTADGHEVTRLEVDMVPPRPEVVGLEVPRDVWDAAPEYFPYLRGRDGFDQLDTRRFDAVISTQPPSFSHRHPRHLSVFYHHHRVYYDLEDLYVEAGFAADAEVHRRAGELIRELDRSRLAEVGWFLAGSAHVAERLDHFNGRTNVGLFHAGLVSGVPHDAAPRAGGGAVLSVGRHEFPKRTELVVAAARLLPTRPFTLVGTGGREAWARRLDARLRAGELDPGALTDAELWCNTGRVPAGAPEPRARAVDPNVEFAGWVDDTDLARRYAAAPCVVAPAFAEDYGLTAIEAMAHGCPVVVCHDGGGLTELVDHDVTGLVVDPTPTAIAAAVERLCEDDDLARRLGANGRERAVELSWDHAADELRAGLDRVLT
jgi:glycosyltransferase involved in cell wall biosynthesis